MSRLGSRKEFKKDAKSGIQYCIDSYLLEETLKLIPKELNIYGINIVLGRKSSSHKIVVPTILKRLGVTYMRERPMGTEISLVFDEINKSTIEKNTKRVCNIMNIDYRGAEVKSITLACKTGSVYFRQVTKEMHRDEKDLRRKVKVLAAISGENKVHDVYALISAKQFRCEIQDVITRIAICTKE